MSELFTNVYTPDVLTCIANLSNDEVFTPPDVANKMIDLLPQELFENPDTRFLDPACKSGVFLREIAKRLIKGLESVIPDLEERLEHIFKNQIYGIAITELTSLISRRSLYCSKYASSVYSVVKFDNIDGNIRFKHISHTFRDGKCIFCGASESEYGKEKRGKGLESHAYEFIHTMRPEEILKMKFDVIIGNPPYQLNVGTVKENYAIPIYHDFISQAKKLKPRFLIMITPSRWFTGGRGLDEFRCTMLSDKSLHKIYDFTDSKDCFPGVDISGGVNYFLWDRDYKGKCEFTSTYNGKTTTSIRDLNEFDIFPRYNQALSIIYKIKNSNGTTMENIVSTQTPFGFITTFRGKEKPFDNCITLKSSKNDTYVSLSEVSRNREIIDHYKVIFSKATCEHAGTPDKNGQFRVISSNQILPPGTVCTQSYLVANSFTSEKEAQNFLGYLRTKFFRFLLLQALTSQDISKDKFCFVPLLDFSKEWSDNILYAKYNLSNEEIDFIESMIRPMDIGGDE